MTKEIKNSLTDTKILTELIDSEQLEETEYEAFKEMLGNISSGKIKKLTPKQRDWAEAAHCRLNLDPGTVNLVSSGQVKVTEHQKEELKKFIEKVTGPKLLRPPGKR